MLIADRYRLDEPIGKGGMGQVWRATDEMLGRPVAVKVLTLEADETAVQRFSQEAQTAGRLNHPNVVAMYDFGSHDGRPYLVMELVDGRNLAEELSVSRLLAPGRVA
ncbi:protein kinase [Streptomyces sp. NPDC056227]|uniref:protein kinase domain-containing protein n=1 Tax=Streptomyces sp. NPDC056227 TaxID=3345753 RepID=UPI0035DD2D84